MNQVNIILKKRKKKDYYARDKNNPYNIQGRVTLPLNFPESSAVCGINEGDKLKKKKPSDQVAVNYKSVTDYYMKAIKEKPKRVQNDDCSIFKEINRLFRNKFESKTVPIEPEKHQFSVNLRKQLKGIRVENFRNSSVQRIQDLMQSDELDELSEVDSELEDNHRETANRDIVFRRNPFDDVPALPSFKFVFTTPINQRLNLVTKIDLSGFDFSNLENNLTIGNVLTFSPLRTINTGQSGSSILEASSFSFESMENDSNKKRMTPIFGHKIHFTPPEGSNFSMFLTPENFQKRIMSPVTRSHKRSKVYFTPPEGFFDFKVTKTSFGGEKNVDRSRKCNFFMEPQSLFNKPFVSPMLTKNYFDLD